MQNNVAENGDRKTRIFISYSRHDLPFVEVLHAALIGRGYDTFIDREDIAPAEDWRGRLDNLILAADVIVFVISDSSLASEICGWEVERTAELGKRLVPLAHGPPSRPIPNGLSSLNWVFSDDPMSGDTTPNAPTQSALRKLCDAVDVDIRWIRDHSDLTARAEEWSRSNDAEDRLLPSSLVDEAARIVRLAPDAFKPIPSKLNRYIEQSRRSARKQMAGEIARQASIELQGDRPEVALEKIRRFAASWPNDVFDWAPELSAVAARSLSETGISFESAHTRADEKRKLAILDAAMLLVSASGAQLSVRSLSDHTLHETVTFDLPIAAIDVDEYTQNVLLTFRDGTVFVWDMLAKRTVRQIIREPIHTQMARFISSGKHILTMEIIEHGRVWDAATGRLVAHAKAGFTSFAATHFDERSDRIVSISGFGDLRQWQVGSSEELPRGGPECEIRESPENVVGGYEVARAEFDPTGCYALIELYHPDLLGQVPRSLYALDRQPDRHALRWLCDLPTERGGSSRAIAFSSDGRNLAIQLGNKSVAVFYTRDGSRLANAPSGIEYMELALGADGEILLGLTASGEIDVWRKDSDDLGGNRYWLAKEAEATNATDRRPLIRQSIWTRNGGVTTIAPRPDGREIVAGFRSGTISVFSLGEVGQLFETGLYDAVTDLVLDSQGDTALVAFSSGHAGIFSLREGKWRFQLPFSQWSQWKGAWLADEESFILASGEGVLRIVNAQTGNVSGSLALDAGHLVSLTHFSTAQFLVGGSAGQVVLVELKQGALVERYRWPIFSGAITALCKLDECDSFVAGCSDGSLTIWDAKKGCAEFRFSVSNHSITSIDASADDTLICVATKGGEVGVYDRTRARPLFWIRLHQRPVWAIRFSPNQDCLVAGLEDGSIRTIDISHTRRLTADYRNAFISLSEQAPANEADDAKAIRRLPDFFVGWKRRGVIIASVTGTASDEGNLAAPKRFAPNFRPLKRMVLFILVATLTLCAAAGVFLSIPRR